MPQDRRKRPRPVEQILRQEAGLGCCVCGHPIFQYHHIVPYTEEDPHYRPDDMMILCPNHHDEATQQVMREATQREHKARRTTSLVDMPAAC
jgi:5-methylcytosine-specific restriction endonuclease McrA